ncbi:YggS family pyridoxal phosphate enzyme [Bacteroidia bacterium]|nr:YggS family pyridoxal phosphate enzyme [Bacteroidia bacterium]
MSIANNLQSLERQLPPPAQIVAVSKTRTCAEIMQAYHSGQRRFGESRPQEFLQKVQQLPCDIEWHFIGHLQSNKIKMVLPHAHLIHSIDSENLLAAIEKFCAAGNLSAQVLLQVHIAQEETKFGFAPDELMQFFAQNKVQQYPHITLKGLMGIASNTTDMALVKQEFLTISTLLKQIQTAHPELPFTELSIGMSGDYALAAAMGSTLVRIGTAIFGERDYLT